MREEPSCIPAIRAELENRPAIEQRAKRAEHEGRVAQVRSVDADLVDPDDVRDLDVADVRRAEAFELDPDALQQSRSEALGGGETAARRAHDDARKDVAVLNASDRTSGGGIAPRDALHRAG